MSRHIVWQTSGVTREERERLGGHRGFVLWFTGLSGAGKSTLAHGMEALLHARGLRTYVLDGDNVRHGLCSDLGFSEQDRRENIRRVGEVCKLFVDAGVIVLSAFISPYRSDRSFVRALMEQGDFVEIYCDASLEVCERRDTKGLYRNAREGKILEFTGISSPYEPPELPELVVESGRNAPEACIAQICEYLLANGMIPPLAAIG
ncbi:adenylyl-sulfate kinase [Methylogaea oryzae]|uniref:Adenylyl-sulfate kinase n=1 Tax=Methylogaea oryzae TaxID=1295382 RepID=A0A8D4VP39_9GAMM|nr:adenylyl-sulfate kinase [Methylogaea oryzae]BBL69910.1 adenylyl-sulfate kinase [Methylogaea oryzae]